MNYPNKCYNCDKEYCKETCPARQKMEKMDTANIKRWAKEHNRLHKQIQREFRIFSIKCKHAGIILNEMLPHPGRCFHNDAAPYTKGFTNCSMTRCPVLNLENY
jgi:hypothetical protein